MDNVNCKTTNSDSDQVTLVTSYRETERDEDSDCILLEDGDDEETLCPKTPSTSNKSKTGKSNHSGHGQRQMHICRICNSGFRHPNILKRHMKKKHAYLDICRICKLAFYNEDILKGHMIREHTGMETQGQKFKLSDVIILPPSSQSQSSKGRNKKSKRKRATSEEARYQYQPLSSPSKSATKTNVTSSNRNLDLELIVRKRKILSLDCPNCGEKFSSENALSLHHREKHPTFFQCALCPSQFKYKTALDIHLNDGHLRSNNGAHDIDTTSASTSTLMGNTTNTNAVTTTPPSTTCISISPSTSRIPSSPSPVPPTEVEVEVPPDINILEYANRLLSTVQLVPVPQPHKTHKKKKLRRITTTKRKTVVVPHTENQSENPVNDQISKTFNHKCHFCPLWFKNSLDIETHLGTAHLTQTQQPNQNQKCHTCGGLLRNFRKHLLVPPSCVSYIKEYELATEGHLRKQVEKTRLSYKCQMQDCGVDFNSTTMFTDHYKYCHNVLDDGYCQDVVIVKIGENYEGGSQSMSKTTSQCQETQTQQDEGHEGFRCDFCDDVFATQELRSNHRLYLHPYSFDDSAVTERKRKRISSEKVVQIYGYNGHDFEELVVAEKPSEPPQVLAQEWVNLTPSPYQTLVGV